MQPQNRLDPPRRRGVVLVLILAMLGLLALIGVSFATITGQAQTGGRKYAEAAYTPSSEQVMDYALAQLINDTTNPLSAIRGHSLKNDMYGTDAYNNGVLDSIYTITAAGFDSQLGYQNFAQYTTTIPVDTTPDLTRWIIRIAPTGNTVAQTFEVLRDLRPSGGTHSLTLSNPDPNISLIQPPVPPPPGAGYPTGYPTPIPGAITNNVIALDGRFLRAFNGPGANGWSSIDPSMPANFAQYGNFRINGNLILANLTAGSPPSAGNPFGYSFTSGVGTTVGGGMDEDYDAVDTENWFLAMQSADGSVVIPSFHRPGILRASDWTNVYNSGDTPAQQLAELKSMAKILRPRAVDHPGSASTFPDLTSGTYDIDNDGDGITDSVWLDLGYPAQRDAAGKLFKPLFALTVLGTNGRLPLNTAGNLQGRHLITEPVAPLATPSYYAGDPTFNHTSHLGVSPSEINPLFALQNAPDPNAAPIAYSQFDNVNIPVSVTQLRNLLTGTRLPSDSLSGMVNTDANTVLRDGQFVIMGNNLPDEAAQPVNRPTPTVAGRWGEPGFIPSGLQNPALLTPPVTHPASGYYLSFNNRVRAGRTVFAASLPWEFDAADDNFSTLDFLHLSTGQTYPEDADYSDFSAVSVLPSERARRYVKPIDLAGTGRLINFNAAPTDLVGTAASFYNEATGTQAGFALASGTSVGYGLGGDAFGRIGNWGYFRPPGFTSQLTYPAPSNYNSSPTFNSPSVASPAAYPDLTTNPLHGFESERNPGGFLGVADGDPTKTYGDSTKPLYSSAMPYATTSTGNPGYPTFAGPINSSDPYDAASTPNHVVSYGYPGGSLGLNEADEMDLYGNSTKDAPFGPQDLEWLYRKHDVDGASLSSRLAYLAPISFLNSGTNAGTPRNDGMTRRNLFTTDTWDTNGFVLANDNPGGSFPNNSRLLPYANSSLDNQMSSAVRYPTQNSTTNPLYVAPTTPLATPSVAHRDRRINLNFPLPVSNAPDEPVRKKWIADTYQFLLDILPPEAVDTAEEQVQLCQYVVNIIDFRDPDGAMTHFTVPNVKMTPATATVPPRGMLPTDASYGLATSLPIDLYGMEYNPIAINEVLAYSFKRSGGVNGTDTPRFFVELVNTLSPSAPPPTIPASYPANWNPSDVNLTGWDLVMVSESVSTPTSLGEDYTCRPDPLTGQIPPQTTGAVANFIYMPLSPRAGENPFFAPAIPAPNTPSDTPKATYYVLSNPMLDATYASENGNTTAGAGTPNIAPNLDGILTRTGLGPASVAGGTYVAADDPFAPSGTAFPTTGYPAVYNAISATASSTTPVGAPASATTANIPQSNTTVLPAASNPLGSGQAKYFWLYLRRPANPLASADPNPADGTVAGNPMVVVDSFRFPYIEAGAKINTALTGGAIVNRGGNRDLYSVQRLQPYRGGTLIPNPAGATNPSPPMPYGYSEQTGIAKAPIASANNLFGVFPDPGDTNKFYQVTGMNGASPATALARSTPVPTTGPPPYTGSDANGIAQTLGAPNTSNEVWDHFAFHDRDFAGVAELLLVPGCPPGLFTKHFVDNPPQTGAALIPGAPFSSPPSVTSAFAPSAAALAVAPLSNTYPYLIDNFYYSAYGGTADVPPVINGPTAAGWHRMLGLFEVPTTAVNATGPVSLGQNFDWYRQDRRPGQINLNLIIDEEVFFGLIDDPLRMNLAPVAAGVPLIATHDASTPYTKTMGNRGFSYTNDANGHPSFNNNLTAPVYAMKGAFRDFLGLRHMFDETTVPPTPILFSSAAERPFHDLTYPDIDYTIMRPALLPPTVATNPGSNPRNPGIKTSAEAYNGPAVAPGDTLGPPPVPTRRLLQISSAVNSGNASPTGDTTYNAATGRPTFDLSSNTAYLGSVPNDNRQHPVFQTEWLQKVMNNTTVRTHQFAVWVTVGFFEVTQVGDAQTVPPTPDQLGSEVGLREGRNVRYRSFFLLDRTKATGFNLQDPGDYRDLVLYRRRIE